MYIQSKFSFQLLETFINIYLYTLLDIFILRFENSTIKNLSNFQNNTNEINLKAIQLIKSQFAIRSIIFQIIDSYKSTVLELVKKICNNTIFDFLVLFCRRFLADSFFSISGLYWLNFSEQSKNSHFFKN